VIAIWALSYVWPRTAAIIANTS